MKNVLVKVIFASLGFLLTACSSNQNIIPNFFSNSGTWVSRDGYAERVGDPKQVPIASSNRPVGGSVVTTMDDLDKKKMNRALDSSPGKPTEWVNEHTGASYSVEPTKKVNIGGNPYCRQYRMTITKGGRTKESYGTACVGADGNWEAAGG